jgi:hypothetical protein
MRIEKRIPARIVGAAAGKITANAVRVAESSSVRATLMKSRRTLATPNAVLIKIGHSEQMKITNTEDPTESLMTNCRRTRPTLGDRTAYP